MSKKSILSEYTFTIDNGLLAVNTNVTKKEKKQPIKKIDANGKRLRRGQTIEILADVTSRGLFENHTIATKGKVSCVDRVDDAGRVHFTLPDADGDPNEYVLPCEQVHVTAKTKKQKISMASVILPPEKKEAILAAISQVDNHDKLFNEWGFDHVLEKGRAVSLIFWGVPGTGKTLAAQAIADHLGADLKIIGGADLFSCMFGESEKLIKKTFEQATNANQHGLKQILLLDECDSLLMSRDANAKMENIGPAVVSIINCLLTELERYTGVIIFTTNRIDHLDPALERRISAKVEFPFPDKQLRKQIWRRMIPKQAPLAKDVNLTALAEYPIAGGNIKNAVLSAARVAAYGKQGVITQADFECAAQAELASLKAFQSQDLSQPHHNTLAAVESVVHELQQRLDDAEAARAWMSVRTLGVTN